MIGQRRWLPPAIQGQFMTGHIIVSDEDATRVIKLRRPEKKNAFSQDIAAGLAADRRAPAGDARALASSRRCFALLPASRWASTRRCDATRGSSHVLLAVSLLGVSLPTFLIGILLILVFAVQLGWLPSFGRGDTVALGWWTTGLLTASGLKALILPAITLGALPDDADHAAGALGDAGGAAHRLHQVRARARPDRPRDPFRPCAEEHAGAGDHHHRPAARRDHRLRHHHRDGVPVAGHGPALHPGGRPSPTSR